PSFDGELPAVGGKKRVVITDDTISRRVIRLVDPGIDGRTVGSRCFSRRFASRPVIRRRASGGGRQEARGHHR
ncbi:MAG: hypothetical protein ACKOA6_05465, partial [Actinomycetota bacterium]